MTDDPCLMFLIMHVNHDMIDSFVYVYLYVYFHESMNCVRVINISYCEGVPNLLDHYQ